MSDAFQKHRGFKALLKVVREKFFPLDTSTQPPMITELLARLNRTENTNKPNEPT